MQRLSLPQSPTRLCFQYRRRRASQNTDTAYSSFACGTNPAHYCFTGYSVLPLVLRIPSYPLLYLLILALQYRDQSMTIFLCPSLRSS
jgi:hypothetical protein